MKKTACIFCLFFAICILYGNEPSPAPESKSEITFEIIKMMPGWSVLSGIIFVICVQRAHNPQELNEKIIVGLFLFPFGMAVIAIILDIANLQTSKDLEEMRRRAQSPSR